MNERPGPTNIRQRLDDLFLAPLQEVDAQQRAHLESHKRADGEVVWILLSTALLLTIQRYWVIGGSQQLSVDAVASVLPAAAAVEWRSVAIAPENAQLVRLGHWAFGNFVVYVLFPVLLACFVLKRRLSDYGAKLRGALQCWWIYALMYLGILPFVIGVSFTDSFRHTYPFYKLADGESLWPRFLIWEVLYAIQFFSLEFFFRGFMLHGTKRRFGLYAIFVMTIPYCMIHFGKPWPETCGAIGAGVILGFMSLKTRSIWLGAVLHIAVAWTMDTAALLQR